MLGKLSWDAIPFDQPIPMIASGVVALIMLAILAWTVIRGHLPYLWREWITSVDHKRIGVMYTLLAMVMLLRGFADAIMMRTQQALAFHGQGYLPPDHYDQVFSAHGTIMIFFVAMPFMWADELCGAAAARRPRRRLSDAELGRLLADRHRRVAGQHVAGDWRIRPQRLAPLSAAVGACLFARRRRRLLFVVASDIRGRDAGRRRQSRHHRAQGAHQRHELSAHADVLLDHAGDQSSNRRGISDPDRDLGDAAARPLSRLSLLHQ